MHIDWLSISFSKVELRDIDDAADFGRDIYGDRWMRYLDEMPREFYRTSATAPFNQAIHSPLGSIQWKRHKPGVLVNISGKQIQRLDWQWQLHACQHWKITRIDIAHDLYTGDPAITPAYIVAKHTAKTTSEAHSATGDTYYLGSPKSDAMTRVYMYAPPNPRAGVPRIEHQFRRKHAEQVARLVAQDRLYDVYETRNKALNLHPVASAATNYQPMKIASAVRTDDDSKKASWLIKSVKPTLNRLIREGAVTISDILDLDIIRMIQVVDSETTS